MNVQPFALERYFDQYEFTTRYLLSCSDCEALSLAELLSMADPESRKLWDELTLGYTESPGHPMLRQAIADLYDGIETENVMVAAPEECIFLSMHALLRPGDHVVSAYPAYQSLTEIGRSLGCEITPWEPDEASGWHFRVDDLESKLRDNTRLIIVNFPHNPTGAMISADEYRALVDLARARGIYLFSDEIYRFLTMDQRPVLPAGCELYDRAVSFGGLSKCFGLPGLRTGWVATQNAEFLKTTNMLKDYTTICNSAPGEILAIMAFRNREQLVAREQAIVDHNILVLDQFLDEFSDCFSWNRPQGGSICLARMLVHENTFEFAEEMVKETGIMLVPSRMFQFGDHHVRFGFGRKNMPQVLELFGDYLKKRFR